VEKLAEHDVKRREERAALLARTGETRKHGRMKSNNDFNLSIMTE